MKTRLLMIILVIIVNVFLFFNFTAPSTFDFLMDCPEEYYVENLFCIPDRIIVDTAASDWIGRFMMLS